MFNVYLPKLLEGRGNSDGGTEPKPLEESLWDVVIYSIGGCPGAIVRLRVPHIPFLNDSNINLVGRIPSRLVIRSSLVPGREYVCDSLLLCHLCLCTASMGCPR